MTRQRDEYDLVAFEIEQTTHDEIDRKAGRKPRRGIESRTAREKKRIDGGRRRRTSGRTAQLNVTTHAALKDRLQMASDDYRLTIVELVEAALTAFLDGDGPRKLVAVRLDTKRGNNV